MITYNRLEYTKRALSALLAADECRVTVIDNGSTDGTVEWLKQFVSIKLVLNGENEGIASAMNTFIVQNRGAEYLGKVDNDTIVPREWATILREKAQACGIDIIQAAHPIIQAVAYGKSFAEWTADMTGDPFDASIRYHHFVGGTGIIFRGRAVRIIPSTKWKLYGWRQFQRTHPRLKKAFCTDVQVELLDAHGYTDYPEYYKETGRR